MIILLSPIGSPPLGDPVWIQMQTFIRISRYNILLVVVNVRNDKTTIIIVIIITICTNIFIKNYFSRSDDQADGGYTILELSIPYANRHNNIIDVILYCTHLYSIQFTVHNTYYIISITNYYFYYFLSPCSNTIRAEIDSCPIDIGARIRFILCTTSPKITNTIVSPTTAAMNPEVP